MKSIMFPPKFGDKVQRKKIKPLLSFGAEMEVDEPMGEPIFETKVKSKGKGKKDDSSAE